MNQFRKCLKNCITIVLLFLTLLLITSCQPEPEPTRLPEPTEQPEVVERPLAYTAVMPLFFGPNYEVSEKAGLAVAMNARGTEGQQIAAGLLFVSADVYIHRWECNPLHPDLPPLIGIELPNVWGLAKNGFDYLGCFEDFLDAFRQKFGFDYAGPVMCCNECDRPDQCAEEPRQVAMIMIGIHQRCPDCGIVGPGYSKADDGQKARMAWIWVLRLCGSFGICETIQEAILAYQPHHFVDGSSYHIETRLALFCDFMDGDVIIYWVDGVEQVRRDPNDGEITPCSRPIWPTVGRLLCRGSDPEDFEEVIRFIENSPAVERYFVYTPNTEEQPCGFDWLLHYANRQPVSARSMGIDFFNGRFRP